MVPIGPCQYNFTAERGQPLYNSKIRSKIVSPQVRGFTAYVMHKTTYILVYASLTVATFMAYSKVCSYIYEWEYHFIKVAVC